MDSPDVETAYAVTRAWRWSPDALADAVRDSGLTVVEVHTRTGVPSGPRPHGALRARLDDRSSRCAIA